MEDHFYDIATVLLVVMVLLIVILYQLGFF
jgi:hypothetical protein